MPELRKDPIVGRWVIISSERTKRPRDLRLRYVMIFKNHGALAGASLTHAHSQLIALPIVPKTVGEEMEGARQYYEYKERCVFCDILKQELRERTRLVYENAGFVVVE